MNEQYHAFLLANPDKRPHSMSLQYSNKKVKELKDKVKTAFILWGTEEQAGDIVTGKQIGRAHV